MNIFDQYLDKLKKVLLDLSKNGKLILPDKLNGITAEIPPSKFKADISTNVAMILSKINKKSPIEFAEFLIPYLKDESMETITVANPGFINIKFKPSFWSIFTKEIIWNTIYL